MALPRFYLPPDQWNKAEPILADREAHHALHVLRLNVGDALQVLDGQGSRAQGEVTRTNRHEVCLQLKERNTSPAPPRSITLLQAIAKPKAMDWIVQKATELGVRRIVPLLSERVTAQWDPKRSKVDKWRWVAIDAMKQCDTPWLPEIVTPTTWHESLRGVADHHDLVLVGSLRSTQHPRPLFDSFRAQHGHAPRSVAMLVGPEGDFTNAELADIESLPATPITLGDRVLRSETAAIYCLSIIQYELSAGDNA